MISVLGLRDLVMENILNTYGGFPPKEEMVDYCKGDTDQETLRRRFWIES